MASILFFSSSYRVRASIAIFTAVALLWPALDCARPRLVFLPFRSVHSLILIDAKINGNEVTLLLDTGANNTIVSARAYGNLPEPLPKPTSKGPGIVGDALRLRVDLEIGGRLFSQPVSVMNLGELPQRIGAQFEGLLGQDILRQFRSVHINYHTHVIELEE